MRWSRLGGGGGGDVCAQKTKQNWHMPEKNNLTNIF